MADPKNPSPVSGATQPGPNRLVLAAQLTERDALRYTPAGLPALNCWLAHASQVVEAGQPRQVGLRLKAVALGAMAERLQTQEIGSSWLFQGFLASPNKTRQVVFHIQDFGVVTAPADS
ncbi:MAG: primosomal replication protein N [Rhodoferax sp.]